MRGSFRGCCPRGGSRAGGAGPGALGKRPEGERSSMRDFAAGPAPREGKSLPRLRGDMNRCGCLR